MNAARFKRQFDVHTPLHPVSPRLKRMGADEWKFVNDSPARRLSYRETARLQGFRRAMRFPETAYIRMRYRVIGNPPDRAELQVRREESNCQQ